MESKSELMIIKLAGILNKERGLNRGQAKCEEKETGSSLGNAVGQVNQIRYSQSKSPESSKQKQYHETRVKQGMQRQKSNAEQETGSDKSKQTGPNTDASNPLSTHPSPGPETVSQCQRIKKGRHCITHGIRVEPEVISRARSESRFIHKIRSN